MAVIHIGTVHSSPPKVHALGQGLIISQVLFKFRPDVSQEHKDHFVAELKKLKNLPCVQDAQLTVGGPSITNPIERSKGFEFALVSRHKDKAALAEYQASKEHHE